jgi:hypothetical protein
MERRERFGRERLGTYDPSGSSAPTDQEFAEVTRFMEQHSPNRFKRLNDVPNERREGIVNRIVNHYRTLQRLKQDDPEIYDLRLKRLPIEDQMFTLGWELSHDEDVKRAPELRSRLREQVRLFFDNCLEERRIRIERIQQQIKKDQQRLAEAQEKYQQIAQERDDRIEKGVDDMERGRGEALKDLAMPFPKHPGGKQNAGGDTPASQ